MNRIIMSKVFQNNNNGIRAFGKKVSVIFLCLLLCGASLNAQAPSQTIRGQVWAESGEPLLGASVTLLDTEPLIGTVTDENGRFYLENVKVGYVKLQVSFIGYASVVFPELLVEAGREQVLEVYLEAKGVTTETLKLYAPPYSPASIAMVSKQTLTIEEARRFPATFDDLARLTTSYAGVVNNNDQANNIVIRGNSPNNMSWHLEGVEIVNPNHLSTAGTSNDRLAANGGGVNILSAQLLGASTFLSSAFPSNYGNSLSGIMDMRLRSGNDERYEFTGQIGLIGLDLAAEGPFSKKSNASFLVNYRYSTLGVLSAMGVDLGDEAIAFQDLAFNVKIPTSKAGKFSLFGIGGRSTNVFEAQRDTSLWELQKDRFDIDYASQMGVIGATHVLPLGATSVWRSSIAYSGLESVRTGTILRSNFDATLLERDTLRKSKLAISTSASYRPNPHWRFELGLRASLLEDEVFADGPEAANFSGSGSGWLLQPYANVRYFIPSLQLEFLAGLHYAQYTFNGSTAIEPRASLLWKQQRHQWSLAYGLHSKLQEAQLYFLEGLEQNRNLDFTRAHHLVLAHEWSTGRSSQLKSELYYQRLFDVPVVAQGEDEDIYSALNLIEAFITPAAAFQNNGTGRNFGLEVSWQHFISQGYYYLLNATFYDSKYEDGGELRNTRFNGRYIFNVTGGKEFVKQKKGKQRTLGLNLRISYIGGFWETPIDLERSALAGYTVFEEAAAYSVKMPDIFKVDARLYWRKDKGRSSSTWALDLQNATNQQNLAFRYYDALQGAIVDKNQLGLIPNLSWRKNF